MRRQLTDAESAGYYAYQQSRTQFDNPYPYDTIEAKEWISGWMLSEENDKYQDNPTNYQE